MSCICLSGIHDAVVSMLTLYSKPLKHALWFVAERLRALGCFGPVFLLFGFQCKLYIHCRKTLHCVPWILHVSRAEDMLGSWFCRYMSESGIMFVLWAT